MGDQSGGCTKCRSVATAQRPGPHPARTLVARSRTRHTLAESRLTNLDWAAAMQTVCRYVHTSSECPDTDVASLKASRDERIPYMRKGNPRNVKHLYHGVQSTKQKASCNRSKSRQVCRLNVKANGSRG